jgi:hypothetical protein
MPALNSQGVIMPKHPVDADVKRFMELYGPKFSAIVTTEEVRYHSSISLGIFHNITCSRPIHQVLLFPEPKPLKEAAESLNLLPHQCVFVGGAELISTAKEARAFTCLLLGEREEGGGTGDTEKKKAEAIVRKLRPDHTVEALAGVALAVNALNNGL